MCQIPSDIRMQVLPLECFLQEPASIQYLKNLKPPSSRMINSTPLIQVHIYEDSDSVQNFQESIFYDLKSDLKADVSLQGEQK